MNTFKILNNRYQEQFNDLITQTEKHESLSDKYQTVSTMEPLEKFKELGFEMTQFQAVRTKESKRGFQKHIIRLAHPDFQISSSNDLRPEVVMFNSYDGSTAFCLMAGIFRFVCSNGLIVGDNFIPPFKMKHMGSINEEIPKVIENFSNKLPMLKEKVNFLKDHVPKISTTIDFANEAVKLRWTQKEFDSVEKNTPINPADFLKARRFADNELNMWHVFNSLQENLIKGGLYVHGKNGSFKVKEIRQVDKIIKMNKELWNLAEQFSVN